MTAIHVPALILPSKKVTDKYDIQFIKTSVNARPNIQHRNVMKVEEFLYGIAQDCPKNMFFYVVDNNYIGELQVIKNIFEYLINAKLTLDKLWV